MNDMKINAIEINRDRAHIVFLGLPNIPGVAAEVFRALSERGVGVDMVTQNTMRGGRSDLSFLVRRDRLDELIPLCRQVSEKVGAQGVSFATEVVVLSVRLGDADASTTSQVLAKMFSALASAGVNIEIINSTLASVVCMVSLTRAEEGLRALEEEFGRR